MIGYVTIGALNVEDAMPFYDAVLGAIGYERQFFDSGWAGYGPKGQDANTFLCPPFDGQQARGRRTRRPSMARMCATRRAIRSRSSPVLEANGRTKKGRGHPRPFC